MIRLHTRPLRRDLARLVLVLLTGACLAGLLGLIYPVQREMDTSMYSRAAYTTLLSGVFPSTVADELTGVLGDRSCLVSLWMTAVGSASVEPLGSSVQAVAPNCHPDAMPLPAQAVVAGPATDVGADWIDLSADLARDLHVGLGDAVSVGVGPDNSVTLRVRSILAVREWGWQYVAMAPGDLLMRWEPPDDRGYGTALTFLPPEEALARLAASPVGKRLEATDVDEAYPPDVSAVADLAATASEQSANSLGLIRTVGAFALAGVGLLILREIDVFRRRANTYLSFVHQVGGDIAASGRTVHVTAFGSSAAALSGGLLLAWGSFSSRLVASCFPPVLNGLLLGAYAFLLTVLAAASLAGYLSALRIRGD
jgi:hypothetical protein